jgi:predicted outer membrane protein
MMMRLIAGLVAILPAVVIMSGVIATAETPRKHSLIEALGIKELVGWPPNAADVLRYLHQFNMFQVQAAGLADARGDDALRQYAFAQARLARERDQQVVKLNTFTLLSIDLPNQPNVILSNELAGLRGAVGRRFIADFHAKQIQEFHRTVDVMRRYLLHPDNDQIRRFAAEQLPLLERDLEMLEGREMREDRIAG